MKHKKQRDYKLWKETEDEKEEVDNNRLYLVPSKTVGNAPLKIQCLKLEIVKKNYEPGEPPLDPVDAWFALHARGDEFTGEAVTDFTYTDWGDGSRTVEFADPDEPSMRFTALVDPAQ
jgi:hypothetical protein